MKIFRSLSTMILVSLSILATSCSGNIDPGSNTDRKLPKPDENKYEYGFDYHGLKYRISFDTSLSIKASKNGNALGEIQCFDIVDKKLTGANQNFTLLIHTLESCREYDLALDTAHLEEEFPDDYPQDVFDTSSYKIQMKDFYKNGKKTRTTNGREYIGYKNAYDDMVTFNHTYFTFLFGGKVRLMLLHNTEEAQITEAQFEKEGVTVLNRIKVFEN